MRLLNIRRRSKQPHQPTWGLPQGKGTNIPLDLWRLQLPPNLHWIPSRPVSLPIPVQRSFDMVTFKGIYCCSLERSASCRVLSSPHESRCHISFINPAFGDIVEPRNSTYCRKAPFMWFGISTYCWHTVGYVGISTNIYPC